MSSFRKDDIPNQFRRFFISYSMSINRQQNLSGNLFCRPFKRLQIEDEDYLRYLAFYIHYNPQKHGYINDFKKYKFSSWQAYASSKPSKINRKILIELFGGHNDFIDYHNYLHEEKVKLTLE